jgi:hypothetical protein
LGRPVMVAVNRPPRVSDSLRDCSVLFTADAGITTIIEQKRTARRIYPIWCVFMMATFVMRRYD